MITNLINRSLLRTVQTVGHCPPNTNCYNGKRKGSGLCLVNGVETMVDNFIWYHCLLPYQLPSFQRLCRHPSSLYDMVTVFVRQTLFDRVDAPFAGTGSVSWLLRNTYFFYSKAPLITLHEHKSEVLFKYCDTTIIIFCN